MPERVTLTINGTIIKTTKGAIVLEVALDYAICIPHLCHVRTITPIGACRLCIVEVIQDGKTK
jgi:formate dehydrogenase beta subunit